MQIWIRKCFHDDKRNVDLVYELMELSISPDYANIKSIEKQPIWIRNFPLYCRSYYACSKILDNFTSSCCS